MNAFDSLRRTFRDLNVSQRATMASALVVVLLAGAAFVRWASAPSYTVLYSDVAASQLSDVVDARWMKPISRTELLRGLAALIGDVFAVAEFVELIQSGNIEELLNGGDPLADARVQEAIRAGEVDLGAAVDLAPHAAGRVENDLDRTSRLNRVEFDLDGHSTWTYHVQELPTGKDLSHWNLKLDPAAVSGRAGRSLMAASAAEPV